MRHALYMTFGTLSMALLAVFALNLRMHPLEAPIIASEPTQDLPLSLDYHLLAADIAWQRHLWDEASTHYLVLAKATKRTDFALLATSAALESEQLPQAYQSSQFWAALEPTHSEAQALASMIAISMLEETQALENLNNLMEFTPEKALPHLMLMTSTLLAPAEQQLFLSLLTKLSVKYAYESHVWFALARQAQSMQDYVLALHATDQSLALAPEWISAIALKVQILYQTAQKAAARDYLAEVLEKYPHETDLQYIYSQIEGELQ